MPLFRKDYYKTIVFDSFERYYPEPTKYIPVNTNNNALQQIAGERVGKLNPILDLLHLQTENRLKDLFFLSDFTCPELYKDLIERIRNDQRGDNFRLFSWISEGSEINMVKQPIILEIANIGPDPFVENIDNQKNEVLQANRNLFQYIPFEKAGTWKHSLNNLLYQIRKRLKTFCAPNQITEEINSNSLIIEKIITDNFNLEDFRPVAELIRNCIHTFQQIGEINNSKIVMLNEIINGLPKDEMAILCENDNEDDIDYLKKATGIAFVSNRKNVTDQHNYSKYYLLDFEERDLLRFYEKIVKGKLKYILFEDEEKRIRNSFRKFTGLFNDISDINRCAELFNCSPEIFRRYSETITIELPERSAILHTMNNVPNITEPDEMQQDLHEIFLRFLMDRTDEQHSRYFKNQRDINKRWVLIFENGEAIPYADNHELWAINTQEEDELDVEGNKTVYKKSINDLEPGQKIILLSGNLGDDYAQTLNTFLEQNESTREIYHSAFEWLDKLTEIFQIISNVAEITRMLASKNFKKTNPTVSNWLKRNVTEPDELDGLLRAVNETIKTDERLAELRVISDIMNVIVSVEKLKNIKSAINSTIKRNAITNDLHSIGNHLDADTQMLIRSFQNRINIRTVAGKLDLNNIN